MVLTGEAVKMLQEKYPEKRVISGMDMTTFYAFQLWDRSVHPKSVLEFPVTPALYAVNKKDGAEFHFHAYLSDKGTFAGEIDVTPYLTVEDARFAKGVRRMISEEGQ